MYVIICVVLCRNCSELRNILLSCELLIVYFILIKRALFLMAPVAVCCGFISLPRKPKSAYGEVSTVVVNICPLPSSINK